MVGFSDQLQFSATTTPEGAVTSNKIFTVSLSKFNRLALSDADFSIINLFSLDHLKTSDSGCSYETFAVNCKILPIHSNFISVMIGSKLIPIPPNTTITCSDKACLIFPSTSSVFFSMSFSQFFKSS